MKLIDLIQFLPSTPDSSLLYPSSYSPVLVIVSILTAIAGSYAALSVAPRIMQAERTSEKLIWILVGALAMGSSVWAMHFIGMLSLKLPCSINYDPPMTFASMVPCILASGVALSIIGNHGVGKSSMVIGSVLLGAGIGTMHYTGMAAMRLEGLVRYDPTLFVLSILVAVALAYVALRVKAGLQTFGRGRDLLGAVVMGGAISGMHYTAMSAAYFVRGNAADAPFSSFSPHYLTLAVLLVAVLLAAMAIVAAIAYRNMEMVRREANWRFALEGAGYGVWDWNVQTGEMLLSKRWKEMVGMAEDKSGTRSDIWSQFVHPDDIWQVTADVDACLNGKSSVFINEHRVLSKDGSWRWILDRGAVVSRSADGQPLRMIGTHTDITERKQIEETLRQKEDQLHLILDSTAEAIYGIDLEGRCTFCNTSCLNLLGYTRAEELLGKNMYSMLHQKHSDETPVPKKGSQVYQAIKTWGPTHSDDEVFWRADGSSFYAEYWSHPQFRDGEVVGAAVTFMDITERKRAQDREDTNNRVLYMLAKGAPLNEVLQAIVLGIERQSPAMLCSVLLLDADGKHLLIGAAPSLPDFFNTAMHGAKIGMGMGSCGTAAFTGKRVVVEDIQTHPYWEAYKDLAVEASLRSCWSEPIKSASGKVLGTFAIYHRDSNSPTETDIKLIEQVASLTGIAIDLSRANEERQLALLVYQNSSEAMMVTDAENVIITINPAFTKLTGYTLEEVLGKNPNVLSFGHQDEAFYESMWHAINTTGYWQGEIWNRRKNGEVFAEWLTINTTFNEDGSVHSRVALFSDITKKKESDELIWLQANFDPLTNLPNRHMFYNRLEQEIKKSHRVNLPLALIFLDLDRFKEVNDTLGHDMGDVLLRDAAQRLSSCVRETDVVARLGGDEFTIIVGELTDVNDVERVAQNILMKIAEPFQLGIETAYLSASLGITFYPEDAGGVEALLKNADQAMYAAKSQGRNRYNYFTPSMQEAAQSRMRLANDLRLALAQDQLRIYYQPIVELATGAIHKAEALIRWQHPTRGLINPSEFIHIAEETGLIIDIGEWVFHEAAAQAGRWRATYDAGFQISVNKSPVQFHNAGQDHRSWTQYLQELGLPGQCIVVEITESLLLDAGTSVTDKLLEFRDAGMQVSLDDFGTGYSALAYLKKFHIDYLKIDQSFTRNLAPESEDMVLCEAIIVMAHKLGIKVIAEGVETVEQRDLLIAAGCDCGQGYLFAKAVTAEEFEKMF